jgi:hypothetical protein
MSETSPTPDMLERFHRKDRFDGPAQDRSARNAAPQIDSNELGPHCHLDGPARGEVGRHGGHLGTGSDSVKDAACSIASGAKAPKVDWPALRKR